MKTTLIVMAAGMASRYGGNKQITGMGPGGELLLEYSAFDAARAGFERVVLVIRPDMLETVRALCGDRIARNMEVRYAFQDYSSLPAWYGVPPGRVKPYGTVHAVLCAREQAEGPCAVINADDYYGVDAFQAMRDFLISDSAPDRAAMMGYRLKNTVSANGTVTRGICRVENGLLADVRETPKIRLEADGAISDISSGEPGSPLDPEALVSMNFWGFHPSLFDAMQREFEAFLRACAPDDLKAEFLLPVFVDRLLKRGELDVRALQTDAKWFGVTYQEDRPLVQAALRALHEQGVYGPSL